MGSKFFFGKQKIMHTFAARNREIGTIAQLVEQRTENPCVPGSIPGGTTKMRELQIIMDAVTYTDLRHNLSAYIDKVIHNRNSLIVTRNNSENVVLMAADEYNSLMETAYLLSNEANADHLKKSIAQHKAGRFKKRELCEDE